MQSTVEAPLYGSLVAGELGEGVRSVRVSDKGSTERGGFGVLLDLHLLGLGECFLTLLIVSSRSTDLLQTFGELLTSLIDAGLLSGPFSQLLEVLPSEYAGFHPPEAAQPPICSDNALHE